MLYHCAAVLLLCIIKAANIRAQCSKPFQFDSVTLTDRLITTDSFTDGAIAEFMCMPGFEEINPNASKTAICMGNKWTKLELKCTRKSCRKPPEFPNGKYDVPIRVLFGDSIKVVCDKGYVNSGPSIRTCRAAGTWDGGEPICKKLCPYPNITHAYTVDGKADPINLSDYIIYNCQDGYIMKGAAKIVCTETGWQPDPPRCIATATSYTVGTISASSLTTLIVKVNGDFTATSYTEQTASATTSSNDDIGQPPHTSTVHYGWIIGLVIALVLIGIFCAVFWLRKRKCISFPI